MSGLRQHPERDLEQAASGLLAWDGWRTFKTDPVSDRSRGKGFGEKGMCDRLYIRYGSRALAQVLWIEWKALGGRGRPRKAAPHQVEWQVAERARGALVVLAGADFTATWDGFLTWYRASGLMWKSL